MGILHLTIVKGRDLDLYAKGERPKEGETRVYFAVKCGGEAHGATQVKHGEKPEWDDSFEIECQKHTMPTLILTLCAIRPDAKPDDAVWKVAGVRVPISALDDRKEYSSWHSILADAADNDDDELAQSPSRRDGQVPEVGQVQISMRYVPGAHEKGATQSGLDQHLTTEAENAMAFATRMAIEEARHAKMLDDAEQDEQEADEAPEWLAGYKRFGMWDPTVHGRPDPVRTRDGGAVEGFPPRVAKTLNDTMW